MRRLYTLGRFELREDAPKATGQVAVQPKRLAILAYLALAEPRGFHRRDTLLGLFWPELSEAEARRSLRQALHQLRKALGENAIATRSGDQLALEESCVWCDALELERASMSGDDERALSLYEGDFLEGIFVPGVSQEFDEWLSRERRALRARAVDTAVRVSRSRERDGNVEGAVLATRRAFDLAPDDESVARRLIELLDDSGDRALALREFDELASRLRAEFDIAPAAETQALAESIRHGTRESARDVVPDAVPDAVPDSAPESAPATVTPTPREAPRQRRRYVAPAAIGALALVAALGALAARRATAGAPEAAPGVTKARLHRDRIFVARFTNGTADSSLAPALEAALEVDLAQSPLVEVLSADQRRGALRRMQRPTPIELSLDDSVARALAEREGVKAFITGDVRTIAGSYVVSASVVGAPDGGVLAAVRETARDSSELLAALGRVSSGIRREIGEAVSSVSAGPALEQVTTASLPALRDFTGAMHEIEVTGDRDRARRALEDAVRLDSGFATAWWMLGGLYAAQPEPARAANALARAYAHRDRLPLRERYLVMGSYHRNVTHEYDKASAAYRALLELYPADIAGMNNLAMVYNSSRDLPRAESVYVRLLAVDSTIPSVYLGLAQNLSNQGKFATARAVLDGVHARFPEYRTTMLTEAYLAAAQQDWPTANRWMERRLASANGSAGVAMDAHQTLGEIALTTGRLKEADGHFRAAMRLAIESGSPSRYLASAIMLGWLELRYRHHDAVALAVVDSALARFPLARMQPADRPYADLATLWIASGVADRARAMLAGARADSASRAQLAGAPLHRIAGELATAAHRGRDAIGELREADAFDRCTVCELPALARAYEDAGDDEGAVVVYERYLNTPWMWRFETDAPELAWSIERLAGAYERRGQTAKARASYQRLLRLWRGADAELAPEIVRVRRKAGADSTGGVGF